ncbi:hypothetical protein [Falsiroseomonas tokyonensis]|uniref:Uncharacterized protein n=1 Tax=Falsiroseomonas tokyonensis TaxID=430521 RepID=A0ABV7BZX5_9PROT|nr:hypothetical protein [Falsiroseomonas tokyonensis]MBU8540205.1 hypothetical protein [Falsiroseomonas tokyonensis]
MADGPWTSSRVEAELRLALVTLRRIPSKHLFPAGLRSAMPEVVKGWGSYGWDSAKRPRVQATSEDIRAMDVALGWIWSWVSTDAGRAAGLVQDAGNILLMRAAGLTWEHIGQWRLERWAAPRARRRGPAQAIPGGNSITALRKAHRAAIAHIVLQLGGRLDERPAPAPYPDEEWGVSVAVARPGEDLGRSEHSGQPIVASARWGITRKPAR